MGAWPDYSSGSDTDYRALTLISYFDSFKLCAKYYNLYPVLSLSLLLLLLLLLLFLFLLLLLLSSFHDLFHLCYVYRSRGGLVVTFEAARMPVRCSVPGHGRNLGRDFCSMRTRALPLGPQHRVS